MTQMENFIKKLCLRCMWYWYGKSTKYLDFDELDYIGNTIKSEAWRRFK